jgi:hypothetical protein
LALAWAAIVAWAAQSGRLAALEMPWVAALVAAGITLPVLGYATWPDLRVRIERLGLYPLTLLHVWRVPAALLFFGYGLAGALPPLFWILAGVGDFVAGLLAWGIRRQRHDPAAYRRIHRFGFADFLVAVGTGLAFTLLRDPRMAPIVELPLALIPLFGVGLSGASHLIAFDLLRRGVGLPPREA